MAQELTGLEFLKKKEIKNMTCNMGKPFAFICYSHDDYDLQIVMNVFKQLMNKGHNLWIDTANMPTDEYTWKKSARNALRNKNCKIAFFFRSESFMVKNTIAKELDIIKILKHIRSIVTIDIWHEDGMNADLFYAEVLNDGAEEEIDACEKICETVDTECKAIRLAGDAGNDILKLVEEMEEELKNIDDIVLPPDDNDGEDLDIEEDDDEEKEDGITDRKSETIIFAADGSIFHIKGRDDSYDAFYRTDGTTYTVLRGSKIRYSDKWTPKRLWDEYKNRITEDGHLLCDIGNLKISAAAKLIEGTSTNGNELSSAERRMKANESYTVSFDSTRTVGKTGKIKLSAGQKPKYADGYHYYIYDTEYHAGRREQANLMYDTFKALTDKYPEKAADIAKRCTSVAKKSDVLSPGTHDSKPPYFRMCKEYTILGVDYVVGSSYGFDAKIAEIYRMVDACDEDRETFRLDGYEQKTRKPKTAGTKEQEQEEDKTSAGEFVYELWGVTHTAGKLSVLMHDVFDLIASRYSDRMPEIAQDDSITAVAYKAAVDNKEIPMSKLNYFKAKKEHDVNGDLYYVSTRYNREQGIGQLQKMLEKCEGNSGSLKIISYPQKSSHGRVNGKVV